MLALDLHGAEILLEWLAAVAAGRAMSETALDEVVAANAFFVDFYSGWDGCNDEVIREVLRHFHQPERVPQSTVPSRLAEGFRLAVADMDTLKSRMAWVSGMDLTRFADHILSFLPPQSPLDAVIHITVDQFNNAFVHQNGMGVSLLKGMGCRQDFEAVVAHELHHICFRYWSALDTRRQKLIQEHTGRSVAVMHVENLLMEGLANYYCTPQYVFASYHSSEPANAYLARLARLQREEAQFFARAEAVLAQSLAPSAAFDPCMEALKSIAFDMEDMLLPAGHYLGARMLQAMAHCLPQHQIVGCIQRLPEFLPLYNQAARQSGGFCFSAQSTDCFESFWEEPA